MRNAGKYSPTADVRTKNKMSKILKLLRIDIICCDVKFLFVFGATAPSPPAPQWARATAFTRFLEYTLGHTTVGRTSLDEWSARRRDLYITSHTHSPQTDRQTSMPAAGFKPTISASERPQNLDLAATWIGDVKLSEIQNSRTYCLRLELLLRRHKLM
jgi:hypothetical protein